METPVLDGPVVRLEPLREHHLAELEKIAFDPDIWKYMILALESADDIRGWAQEGWRQEASGRMMSWAILSKNVADGSEKLAGATRFMDINLKDRNVEIGNTWLGAEFRGTRVNTASKFLQLQFAFEQMGLERVALKAHTRNLRSQAAIRAIGGVYEGTFRRHMVMPDGTYRDSAWFSIIRPEWPDVKEMLERRLNTPVVR